MVAMDPMTLPSFARLLWARGGRRAAEMRGPRLGAGTSEFLREEGVSLLFGLLVRRGYALRLLWVAAARSRKLSPCLRGLARAWCGAV